MPAPCSGASSGFVGDAPQPALAAAPAAATDQRQDRQLEPATPHQASNAGAEAMPIQVLPLLTPTLTDHDLALVFLRVAVPAAAAGSNDASSMAFTQGPRSHVASASTATSASADSQAAAQVTSRGAGVGGLAAAAAAEQPAADAATELDAASSGTRQQLPGTSDAEGSTADGGGGDSAISI
jgi:hypothetical protein